MQEVSAKANGNLTGERIRELRLEMGLTQEELGKRIGGYTKQAISRLEKGLNKFTDFELLDVLGEELHCTSDFLLGLTNEPTMLINGKRKVIYRVRSFEIKNRMYQAYLRNPELGELFMDIMEKLSKNEQKTIFNLFKLILAHKE